MMHEWSAKLRHILVRFFQAAITWIMARPGVTMASILIFKVTIRFPMNGTPYSALRLPCVKAERLVSAAAMLSFLVLYWPILYGDDPET
ncbi:hypothetical protein F4678DRAFT_436181 [Xylaria arbuscula]|nr:hypothetical protein F4678DRAFT_436181 [Xylaria arbuscula]